MIKVVDNLDEIEKAHSYLGNRFPEASRYQRDSLKSIDYKTAIEIVEDNLNKDSYILDCGASSDPTPGYLSELGYEHLYAIDLDKNITDMPYYWRIKYMYGSMLNTHFPDNMFDAVITVSSIEHGEGVPQAKRFIDESKRILKDGGLLFITTDYNEAHIDTKGMKLYGLQWKIFDRSEITSIINYARSIGFEPYIDGSFPKQKGTITYNKRLEKGYSFVLLAFRLKKKMKANPIREVNIICASLGKVDGISKYSESLARRFAEAGIKAHLYRKEGEIENKHIPVILEYDTQNGSVMPQNKKTIIELHSPPASRKVLVNQMFKLLDPRAPFWRNPIGRLRKHISSEKALSSLEDWPLLMFNNELAEEAGITKYTLMPHIAYPKINYKKKTKRGICIGSFGFALKNKHFDKICARAKRLGVRAVIVVSSPNVNPTVENESKQIVKKLREDYESDKIKIVDSYDDVRTLGELSVCTHMIFAQEGMRGISGSMRFAMALNVPVIATDSYPARETQAHRVKNLNDITIDYLKKTTEPTKLDDGFVYLLKFLESRHD